MPHISFCGGRERKATSCLFFLWILLEFNFSKNCQHLTNWTRWNKRYKVWSSATSLCKWRFRSHRYRCCLSSPPGGRATQEMFIQGGLTPGPTRHPFIYYFSRKKVPLLYTLYWKVVPLSPFLELCIPLTAARLNRTFSRLYKAIKLICWPFWALSQTQTTDFPTLLYTSTSEIPTLSYSWSLKKVPLSGGAVPYRLS